MGRRDDKKKERQQRRDERQERRREWMRKAKSKFEEWNENGLLDELMTVVEAIQNPTGALFDIIDLAIPGDQPYLDKVRQYVEYIEGAIGDPIGTALQMLDYAIPGENPLLEAAVNVTAFLDPAAIAAIAVEAATGMDIPGMGLDELQYQVIDKVKDFIDEGPNLGQLTEDNENDNNETNDRGLDFNQETSNGGLGEVLDSLNIPPPSSDYTPGGFVYEPPENPMGGLFNNFTPVPYNEPPNENTDTDTNRGLDFSFSTPGPANEDNTNRGLDFLFSTPDPTVEELQQLTTRGLQQNDDNYIDIPNSSNNGSSFNNRDDSIPNTNDRALPNFNSDQYTLPPETGNMTCDPDCYSQCDCRNKELKRRCDLITKDFVKSMKQKGCNTSCYNKTTKRICR